MDDNALKWLQGQFIDECNGVVECMNHTKDMPDIAPILEDIARDQASHAKIYHHILVDCHHSELTDEMKEALSSAEQVYGFFLE